MSKKIKIVLVLVAMLGLAGAAQAVGEVHYFWGNASGDWSSPSTWGDHPTCCTVPSPTSLDQDIAIAIGGVTINVTTDGQGCIDLYGGYDTGINTINVAAGKNLQVTHTSQIGLGNDTTSNTTAIVNAYGSYYSEGLIVGTSKFCTGIVNVYAGGAVNVGAWGVTVGRAAVDTVGTGTINLKGGIMTAASAITINPKGLINIEAGTLKVLGDYHTSLQGYVNTGRIVSHGGMSPHCTLVVSYNAGDGYTYVQSTGCTCVTYLPADLNHDCYVDMLDLASLAQNWLVCTVPTDPSCGL